MVLPFEVIYFFTHFNDVFVAEKGVNFECISVSLAYRNLNAFRASTEMY